LLENSRIVGATIPLTNPVALNAETSTWITSVSTNGGVVSNQDVSLVDAAITYAKSVSIWNYLDRVQFRVGDYLASLVPVFPAANTTYTGNGSLANDIPSGGFSSSDYAESTGLKANGTTNWVNTGYTWNNPAIYPALGDVSVFISTAPTVSGRSLCLTQNNQHGTTDAYGFQESVLLPNLYFGAQTKVSLSGTFSAGFWHVTRTGSALLQAFQNGVSKGTQTAGITVSSSGEGTWPLFCRARGLLGVTRDQFSDHADIGYAVGHAGMSVASAVCLYNMFMIVNGPSGLNRAPVLPDIYVATTGNDTTGTGLIGAPYLTVTKSLSIGPSLGGYSIQIADGTYAESTGGLGYLSLTQNYTTPVTIKAQTLNSTAVIIQGNDTTNWNLVTTAAITNITFQDIAFTATASSLYPVDLAKASTTVNGLLFTRCIFSCPAKINSYGVKMNGSVQQAVAFNSCTWNVPGNGNASDTSCIGLFVQGSGGYTGLRVTVNNPNITAWNGTTGCNGKGIWISGGTGDINGGSCVVSGTSPAIIFGADSSSNAGSVHGSINGTYILGTAGPAEALIIGAGCTGVRVNNIVLNGSELVLKFPISTKIRGVISTAISAGILFKGSTYSDVKGCIFKSGSICISNSDSAGSPYYNHDDNASYCLNYSTAGNSLKWANNQEVWPFSNKVDHNIYIHTGIVNFGNVETATNVASLAALRTAWGTGPSSQSTNDVNSTNVTSGAIQCITYPATGTTTASRQVYIRIRDDTGNNSWNVDTQVFEATNTANWYLYAIPLLEDPRTAGSYVIPIFPEIPIQPSNTLTIDAYILGSGVTWGTQASTDTITTTYTVAWTG